MLGLGSAIEKLSQNIPTFSFPWSDTIKKRAIRYLLDRYVGQFLVESLSLDQLTIELSNGTGSITDLALNIHSLNEVSEQLNLPFMFIDGYVGEIDVTIPWRNIFRDNCYVGISGLKLVLQPKQRDGEISLVDSMIDSMSTSMQIAQECLSKVAQQCTENNCNNESKSDNEVKEVERSGIEAIEHFAKAIDTIFNKIKVRFTDTLIRLEYQPKASGSGIALDIKIDKIDYFDEAGFEKGPTSTEAAELDLSCFTSKKFLIEGVSLFTHEYFVKDDKLKSDLPSDNGEYPTLTISSDSTFYKSVNLEPSEEEFHDSSSKSIIGTEENLSHSSEDLDSSDSDLLSSSKAILIAQLCNRQEIKLKLRKNDSVSGPKVQIEANCGSLITFLSPRQVHLLLELSEGMASPENIENYAALNTEGLKKDCKINSQKPMSQNDFHQIEHDLINCISPGNYPQSHALNSHDGWSSPPDVVNDDEFQPIHYSGSNSHRQATPMTSSTLTDITDFETSYTSSFSSNVHMGSNKKSSASGNDILTNFKIRLNSLCVIVLHEDILISSTNENEITTFSSTNEMQRISEKFFSSVGSNFSSDHCYEEYLDLTSKLKDACNLSHLQCIVTSIIFDGTETAFPKKWEMNTNVSAGWCEIMECLNDSVTEASNMKYNKLLTFKGKQPQSTGNQFYSSMKPKIQVSVSQSQSIQNTGGHCRSGTPKLDVRVNLDECTVEVDISLIDRVNTLLNKQDVIIKEDEYISVDKLPPSHLDNQAFFREIISDVSSKPEMKINVVIKSPLLTLKVYFPIPDMRPISDMNRVPWWKQNIRNDVLTVKAEDFFFETSISSSCATLYEVLSSDIHILFQENENLQPQSILRASGTKGVEKGFNPIRIFVKSFPSKCNNNGLEDEPYREHENIMTKSMMGFLEEVSKSPPDIFQKRKVASQQEDKLNELTIPANTNEILHFINDTLKDVQFDIDISLSDVQLILPSKHIYEVLYNRLVSDLLLWMPSAPKIYNKASTLLSPMMEDLSIGTNLIPDSFYKSVPDFKPFSFKSDQLLTENTTRYTSIYDDRVKDVLAAKHEEKLPSGQTFIGLQVKITNASGIICTPYRDGNYKVVPEKCGQVSFTLEKGFMFIASGYKGNMDACYGSISSSAIALYHKACSENSAFPVHLDSVHPLFPKKLDGVLYPCDTIYKMGGGKSQKYEKKDRVRICFKMDFDLVKNEKVLELAGGMFGLTLRHYMVGPSESWMSQLGDMFNVEDYPIEGYSLPDVITELNFYFENCAIDYRPMHLPLKSYLVVDSFAVSSNLTVKGDSSVLLIIVEDAGLFLSQNFTCSKVNLKDNYVCVADMGVFELCMKLENESSTNVPIQELLFSNNVIHIRTCSDSFKAFMELLIYLANEGDLIQEPESTDSSKDTHVILQPSQSEETVCSPYRPVTMNTLEIVENMMQEAMLESTFHAADLSSEANESSDNVDVFFFPDESKKNNNASESTEPKVRKRSNENDTEYALREALMEECSEALLDDCRPKQGLDEEFCVLDDMPGTGIKSPSGRPKARNIKFEHVSIKDEHFDPTGNFSQEARLSTPKHYPKPQTKHNLQEISIIWYMYGGRDFPDERDNDKNGNQSFSRPRTKPVYTGNSNIKPSSSKASSNLNVRKNEPSVSFANDSVGVTYTEQSSPPSQSASLRLPPSNTNVKWYSHGGSGRCHDTIMEIRLNKIRFKQELYPENNSSALVSRHVFAVNDIEILDRLASSKINKFLYQYSSECFPRQASSSMIQVKAITRKSDPGLNTETSVSISVRPIRLNVDQDALLFLSSFVENVLSADKEDEYGEEEKPYTSTGNSLPYSPVMTVNYSPSTQTSNISSSSHIDKCLETEDPVEFSIQNAPTYFSNVIFSPDVPIKLDYHGKHIDINSQYGTIAGLIIGLGQLNHSEITLKRVEFRSGVLGVNKLINSLVNEWISDIRKNQLPSILGGVGPMHSFVRLFSGVKDLVWLPIEQYHKDGRVLKGLQRGTSAFTSSSAYAVLDLTGRFVGCIQATAETMYDMVSSGPSVRSKSYKMRRGQPKDVREGVTRAFGLVRNGLGDTATTLMKIAAEEHSHKGVSGAVGGVLRQIPPSVVQPIIIASEATRTVIGGMTNQFVPDARKEAADKWKN